jgi:23S rRNA (guanosine2251-2'-O)-methyltransferase
MSEHYFITRQCSNPHCRFRFPTPATQSIKPFCPKCGYQLEIVGQPFINFRPEPEVDNGRKIRLTLLLDNVRSALNVGSILRTCDGLGVEQIYLCGITTTPDNPKIRKTALNAEMNTDWSYHLNALDVVMDIKAKGHEIWSLEMTEHSIPIYEALKYRSNTSLLMVAGNELAGIDPGILSVSDRLIHLPMQGHKWSYNIAVAVGMAASLLLSPGCV